MNTKHIILGLVILAMVGALSFYLGNQSSERADRSETPQDDIATTTASKETSVPLKPAGGSVSGTAPKVAGAVGTGRALFIMADETAPLDLFQSVLLTVSDVSVQNSKTGWVSVLKTTRQFDLANLYQKSLKELFADVGLAPGTYTGLRFTIEKVVLVQKSGLPRVEAYIPSQKLTFTINLVVVKGKTSAVTLTSFSSQALRQARDGSFIFFPVVRVKTEHDIRTVQTHGGTTELFNGLTDFEQGWGMDENRTLKAGFSYPNGIQFDLLGAVIRVIPINEKTSDITFSAADAISAVLQGKYVDVALSIQTVTRQNKQVWQVAGTKGAVLTKVYIDITTGGIIAVE